MIFIQLYKRFFKLLKFRIYVMIAIDIYEEATVIS